MVTNRKNKSGFTLVELLIVISISAVIAGFLIMGFRNFAGFQQFNQAVSDVKFFLNQTRLSARSADMDSSHGIKFNASGMVIFVGDTYSALDPLNQTVNYDLVTLEYFLTGGTDQVVFDKLTGLPSATGTVVVSGVKFSASSTIELMSSGVIQ